MKPQNIPAGLLPCHGVGEARFGDVQPQSDRRQPRDEEVLAVRYSNATERSQGF
jgi:hypothetical protein